MSMFKVRFKLGGLSLIMILGLALCVCGAEITWVGGSGDSNWSSGA